MEEWFVVAHGFRWFSPCCLLQCCWAWKEKEHCACWSMKQRLFTSGYVGRKQRAWDKKGSGMMHSQISTPVTNYRKLDIISLNFQNLLKWHCWPQPRQGAICQPPREPGVLGRAAPPWPWPCSIWINTELLFGNVACTSCTRKPLISKDHLYSWGRKQTKALRKRVSWHDL